ncbi:hypothetical protein [Streptomyces sulphureus]|uniref:hypothetical protein n=1 Tax=Streptomyces sulphureus TaxID=47758 RepID=UPI00036861AF|nr:hypothetical protein [Streptomyces sulphureus]
MTGPDYRLDGFAPVSDLVEDDFSAATLSDDMYTELAAHHTEGTTFLLLYDRAAIWADPGTAEYVGMRIQRDLVEGTFTLEQARQPTVPITQNWLIARGCPPESIVLEQTGPRPADALTSRLEDVLRTVPQGRYTLLDHSTRNPSNDRDGVEVSTLFHDADPASAERPYRLFLEETAPSLASYTVREGAFASAEEATAWLQHRDTPLPLAPAPAGTYDRRAAAALSRTASGAKASPQPTLPGAAATHGTVHTRSRRRS